MRIPEVLCNTRHRYLWRLLGTKRSPAIGPGPRPETAPSPPCLLRPPRDWERASGCVGRLEYLRYLWLWAGILVPGSPHVLNWAWLGYIHFVPHLPSSEFAKRHRKVPKEVGNGGPRNLTRRHLTILACAVVRTAREGVATRGSLSCASPWWFFSFPSFRPDTSGRCYLLNTSGHLRTQESNDTYLTSWIPHGYQKKSREGGRRPLDTIIGSLPGS